MTHLLPLKREAQKSIEETVDPSNPQAVKHWEIFSCFLSLFKWGFVPNDTVHLFWFNPFNAVCATAAEFCGKLCAIQQNFLCHTVCNYSRISQVIVCIIADFLMWYYMKLEWNSLSNYSQITDYVMCALPYFCSQWANLNMVSIDGWT